MKIFIFLFIPFISFSSYGFFWSGGGEIVKYEYRTQYDNKPLLEYSNVFTYFEFWKEVLESEDTSTLVFDNIFIQCDFEQKLLIDSLISAKGDTIIDQRLILTNVTFGNDFEHFGGSSFYVPGLTFKRGLTITSRKPLDAIELINCNISGGIEFNIPVEYLGFIDCRLNEELNVARPQFIQFRNCHIKLSHVDSKRKITNLRLDFLNTENDNIIEFHNTFISDDNPSAVLTISEANDIIINSSIINIPTIFQNEETKKINSFEVYESNLNRITIPDFPEALNFSCRWKCLKGKIAEDYAEKHWIEGLPNLVDSVIYFDGLKSSLHDIYQYDWLIATYKTLHEIYKTRGDMVSANGCYIEMKDVETRRLLYIYQTEGGISNYFTYKLNVWLGKFADYGTNPVKCILYAIKVIFFFAFFYLLFYSKWDNINHKFMLKRSQSFIHFFKGEQKREELFTDSYKEHIHSFADFKKSVQEAKGQIPFFFYLFLRPVYWTARRKIIINEWFYNRLDFTRKSWASLNKKQRAGYGTFYFGALLIYGLYLLTIKFLTAFVISFNSFSSLGFGSLNLTGMTRYLAMVEGFIGWLLLSVFSISLFSQIIQG